MNPQMASVAVLKPKGLEPGAIAAFFSLISTFAAAVLSTYFV